jgi:hypothetical protein
MITRIFDSGLERSENVSLLTRACIGSWGILSNALFLGRIGINWVYEGTEISNPYEYQGISVLVFTDDTFVIGAIDAKETKVTDKTIKIGLVIARNL